jgi:ubiquinol-cytochrome c reductase iron-sulfur subunit
MPVYIAASTDKSWPLLLLLLLLYVLQWMASMTPSADVLALANAEVDVGAVAPGQGMTIKWRGKPIFIRRRTEDEIAEMKV